MGRDKGSAMTDIRHILSLNKVLQTIPSGLFLVDREQRILSWNREAERITGYRADEVLGRHCSFLKGIPCGSTCGLFEDSIPKPIIGVTCSIRGKNDDRIIITKNVDYLRNAKGEIVGGIESFIDITRRKHLEAQLRHQARVLEETVKLRTAELEEERARLGTVLDTMSDFAYITSDDYRIIFMNRAMIETFGDHTGQCCHLGFYDSEAICPRCPMPQIKEGETIREERHLELNNRTYEIIHSPLQAGNGKIHKLSVFRDITERKEAEEKLLESNRELDAFTYTVSHDLRTPLTPIIGFAEFLQEEYRECLDEKGMKILAEIQEQGERMLALMEDLLTLARVGKVERSSDPVDTAAVVTEVLELHSADINDKGVRTTLTALPPTRIPATLISQVFANLIGNALRYAVDVDPRIEIGGDREGERLRFFVRDHGPGISAEEQTRIFDAFCRGSTAKAKKGTGIGLAIVRKTARLFGGRAWIEATPGGGSTFWVEFTDPLSD
jgi:PAS domain S-box-containing protein